MERLDENGKRKGTPTVFCHQTVSKRLKKEGSDKLLILNLEKNEEMSKVCAHCGANAIEVDEEGKLEVCSNCGVVSSEGSFHSHATIQGGEFEEPAFTHDTNSAGVGNWREKRHYCRENTNLMKAIKLLKDQAERLRLSKGCVTQVEEKLKMFYDEHMYEGLPKSRTAYVGGCVYIVCRQNDMVVTLRNVAEAAQCDMSILARCVRKLKERMGVHLEAIEPDQIITNVLSQFEIQDPSTKKLVNDLFEFCSKTMMTAGKRIELTVMALVFMVIDSMKRKAKNRKKIEEVCRLNTVKSPHVQRLVRYYRTELFKLAKNIPWISPTLNPKQIPKFLKEILEYYKNCEDFRNVDFKPHWQERKELIAKEKMQKIEEAEKRIDACQQRCGGLLIDDSICLHKCCKQVSSSLSSASLSSTATDLANEHKQKDVNHICCPHCCFNKEDCPVYLRTGSSSFCKLDGSDMIIECLLRKGYSKKELVESNPESLYHSKNQYTDSKAEREELDDDDIDDEDIHLYIKTEPEVAQAKTLKPMAAVISDDTQKNKMLVKQSKKKVETVII